MDYLPKDATIEQACNWLQAKTGQMWILPRLLECHLTPYFWHDYDPRWPAVYGGRIEGYQSRMMFHGDICRLESDGGDALVNMFAAHDGSLIKSDPALRVPLSELRFKRDSVERVAEIINKTAPAQTATPAPVVQATETKEQRQDRRLKACIDAGLPMNEKAASLRLPYGVANIAKSEGVTRQAFSTDVKAALKRRDSAKSEGVIVHRT